MKAYVNLEKIQEGIKLFGTMEKFAHQSGVTVGTVYKWTKGKSVPTPLSCIKIEKSTKKKIKKEDILPNFDWTNFKLI